jgi:hypothetical protein
MTNVSRLAAIAEATRQGDVQIGPHTQEEMRQEGLSAADVIEALTSPVAEIIEDYPTDPRGASCLILSRARGRSLHLVVTSPPRHLFVITVYDPALRSERWSRDFRRRRP